MGKNKVQFQEGFIGVIFIADLALNSAVGRTFSTQIPPSF